MLMNATMPKPIFGHIVSSYAFQAMIACGAAPHPLTEKIEIDLETAKYAIGLLEILEDKTKNNLDETEKLILENALHQSRMVFIEASKAASSKLERSSATTSDETDFNA